MSNSDVIRVEKYCKLCKICLELCPKKGLEIVDNKVILTGDCIKCSICEKYCPDLAIKVVK
jgi:2-oxoglutarate ferredoxin oxidoreductase subunit delta